MERDKTSITLDDLRAPEGAMAGESSSVSGRASRDVPGVADLSPTEGCDPTAVSLETTPIVALSADADHVTAAFDVDGRRQSLVSTGSMTNR